MLSFVVAFVFVDCVLRFAVLLLPCACCFLFVVWIMLYAVLLCVFVVLFVSLFALMRCALRVLLSALFVVFVFACAFWFCFSVLLLVLCF